MARLTEKEAKELWTKFACAAITGYVASPDIENDDELADDMATVASKCADAMLDEYQERFSEEAPRRKKAKRRVEEEEPEEEDDLDEEDDE